MTTKTQEQNGTQPQTDLAAISDIDKLKAMAYDRMAAMQQLQSELQMINQRISEVAT